MSEYIYISCVLWMYIYTTYFLCDSCSKCYQIEDNRLVEELCNNVGAVSVCMEY